MFLTTELGIGENSRLNTAFPNDYHHTNSDLNNLPGVGCFIKVQLLTTSPLAPIYLGNVTHLKSFSNIYTKKESIIQPTLSMAQSTVKVEVSYHNVELAKSEIMSENKGKSGIYR